MKKKRLFWQLYTSNFLIIFLALFAFTFFISNSFKNLLLTQVSDDLESRAQLLQEEVLHQLRNADGGTLEDFCVRLGQRSSTRITIILPDGLVVADSERDPATMDNHATRPEVQRALNGQIGTSTRFSATLQMNTMYAAIPLREGGELIGVLRTAVPVKRAEENVSALQLQIVMGGLFITLLAALISLVLSRRITRPIEQLKDGAHRFAEGDLDFRLPEPNSEELSELAEVMNTMAEQLQDRISIIVQQHSQQDAVLYSMIEGVLAFDTDERLININRSAAELLKVDPEKVRGKSIQEVVRNVGLQRFVEEALSANDNTEGYVTLVDDVERFLQVHGSILKDDAGMPIGLLVVLNDVTELRTLENVRRDFVANVSHELKTPITSIKGFVETLLDGAINDRDDALRFLGIVSRQADRLNAIIEDLLSLSRIEQAGDTEEISLAPGSVHDALQSAMQVCQHDAEQKNIILQLDCDGDISARMNPPLLEQALVNLVNNAIKYSEAGKRVWLSAAVDDMQKVHISVRDEGYGIEAEHLPRLFERFYRIDKARSRKMGGTGLGLAIVKHIAQAHHGVVTVESSPGSGSKFTIIIPVAGDANGSGETA
ncbi:cell wall metabolism sensor histidine kinase WalK [bacterium]|nr:cell wall metabolism sensor histidine kinase WalK [bacterium]